MIAIAVAEDMFYAMQMPFTRSSCWKLRAAKFFLLRLTMVLFIAFFRTVWAGNYFQGVSPATVPWPGGIVPYLFDTNYTITATESNDIVAGLSEWELAANVKFVPYTNQTNHVLLQYTNDGSGTGYYLSGNPATLMLHGLARGLMCHEGGHLFGLQHEHQRIDRGNYITINTNNIIGGTNGEGGLSEFLIDSNSTSFGAYDLQSVMHYGPDTFTNGLGDSLDPLPAYTNYYHKIGNIALSIGDRAAVSNLYGATLTPLTNMVTNTADGGFGSLRAAIYYANDHPGTTIKFNIATNDPGYSNGGFTISLLGELPPLVSAGTIVDGTTEPGYGSHPIIALDGAQVSTEAGPVSGLHLYGTNCTVRALAFDNFSYAGIQLFCSGATSNTVEDCYAGLKPDGTNAAPNFLAGIIFQFGANDNFIGGLNATQRNVISGNSEYGIVINDPNSDNNVILGNYIGLNASGTASVTNFYSGIGIWDGPTGTIIGGTNAGARNVISGNWQYGIYLGTNVSGVTIQGNFIGTDLSGSNSVPNGDAVTNAYAGIGIFSGANGNVIGGTSAGAGNLISGNSGVGIYLANPGVSNNVVQGNTIGVNVSGTTALPLQQYGIYLIDGASGNTIGGTSAGAGNLISGNTNYGIYISDPGTSNNFVLGNYIGTDFTGTNAIGNGSIGIGILNSASGNFIGGTGAGAGNLISGNTNYGIAMIGVSGNVIQGNTIGTDISGKRALANNDNDGGIGLWDGSANNVIGGTSAGAGNLISGNSSYGIFLEGPGTSGNLVQGNYIGTDLTGTNALVNSTSGNLYAGVALWDGATSNFIGSIGAGNTIAFNGYPYSGYAGVDIYDQPTTNNSIRGNSIFSNDGLGIDLNGDGVTTNHIGYLAGPNDLQNFPIISNAVVSGSSTIISGSLNSTANGTFFIDVYRNPSPDPSGYGQGQFYAGTASLTTDGTGNGTFTLTVSGNYVGQYFSATATSSGGDTSEFDADVQAVSAPASPQFIGPFSLTSTGFSAQISLTVSQNYSIQTTTNLANSSSWVDLTNFTATNTLFLFTDRTATNFRARFYRVVSP
jgi:hypothetical protein